MDISKVKSIHFVGIKGVAMTALAILAKESGISVTGSDLDEEFPTDQTLRRFNISVSTGFSAHHLPNVDLVIYTGAHSGSQNPQVKEAKKRDIQILPHGKALGLMMQGKRQISVAGSHGKTTTSAMIASCLKHMGEDPSFAVGCGEISDLKTSGHNGDGLWFVAEADEYVTDPQIDQTPRFLWQTPEALVITNIDYDHPDAYRDLEDVQKAFIKFSQNLKTDGFIVLNKDDLPSSILKNKIKDKKIFTYGENQQSDYQIKSIMVKNQHTSFEITTNKNNLGEFNLQVPGKHNVYNATAVIAALHKLNFEPDKIRKALEKFSGTKRRFEFITQGNNKLLYDDYAHHPAEITATINAARSWFPKKRLIIIFQPHTYSRTKALLSEFGKALSIADEVIITEIYASSREKNTAEFSGKNLWEKVKEHNPKAIFAPIITDVLQYIKTQTRSNDIIFTMGAGDIFSWVSEIKKVL